MKKMKFLKKPISKSDWDKNWCPMSTDFIMNFEHNVCAFEDDSLNDNDETEWYLKGIARGMWAMQRWMEERMVDER